MALLGRLASRGLSRAFLPVASVGGVRCRGEGAFGKPIFMCFICVAQLTEPVFFAAEFDRAGDNRARNISQQQCTGEKLERFGAYMSSVMPKYIQKTQMTDHGELEFLVDPEGIIPVLTILRDHSLAQCRQLVELTAVDVPKRTYRFEVIVDLSCVRTPVFPRFLLHSKGADMLGCTVCSWTCCPQNASTCK